MRQPELRMSRNERRRESEKVAGRSREGREIRIARPSKKIRCTIFSSSFKINHLGEGRGDLQSATFSTGCFCGDFIPIFEDRGPCMESGARPSPGGFRGALNLKNNLPPESDPHLSKKSPAKPGLTKSQPGNCDIEYFCCLLLPLAGLVPVGIPSSGRFRLPKSSILLAKNHR